MKQTTFFVIVAIVIATPCVSTSIASAYSGTRPGADDGPTVVAVAAYLIDVSAVDEADQSFTADLFVLLSWQDPRLRGVYKVTEKVLLEEIWSPEIQILNRRAIDTTFPDEAEVAPDGTVITRQRYFGSFSAPLDLHDFPLDKQRFAIRLVVAGFGPDELRLVPLPNHTSLGERVGSFSIADWELGAVDARPEPFRVATESPEISGYLISFEGHRDTGFWVGKAFVSVLIIIAMSWVVFWIDPKYVAPRLSVAVTSMLTLIAYRFLLGAILPRLSYLTRMDFFLVGSTLLVLIGVVEVTITTQAEDRGHHRRAQRINRHARWVFPAAFIGLIAFTVWGVR